MAKRIRAAAVLLLPLALWQVTSRPTLPAPIFEIVRMKDDFSARTPPEALSAEPEPAADDAVVFFPEARESDH